MPPMRLITSSIFVWLSSFEIASLAFLQCSCRTRLIWHVRNLTGMPQQCLDPDELQLIFEGKDPVKAGANSMVATGNARLPRGEPVTKWPCPVDCVDLLMFVGKLGKLDLPTNGNVGWTCSRNQCWIYFGCASLSRKPLSDLFGCC